MAQVVEWSLPIPEVCSSNPFIVQTLYYQYTANCIENTKRKEAGILPNFLKKHWLLEMLYIAFYDAQCTMLYKLKPDSLGPSFNRTMSSFLSPLFPGKRCAQNIVFLVLNIFSRRGGKKVTAAAAAVAQKRVH